MQNFNKLHEISSPNYNICLEQFKKNVLQDSVFIIITVVANL